MHLNCIKNLQTEKYSYDYYDIAISYVFFKGNYIWLNYPFIALNIDFEKNQ